ncbi:MAG: hypothetical protein IJK18_05070 [Clostridia bacterium]|nr:hypothetical protein [Clostridia bacterium]
MELVANKSLTEVYEVIKRFSEYEYNKIPKETIDVIVKNKDNEYNWKYDDSKSLLEQSLSREAIAILSYINLEYLLSGEKRNLMEEIYKMNERKLEQKKSELYKTDELFKNRNIVENEEAQIKENNVSLIEVKENIFTKFIKRIKNFFNVK